MRKTRCATNPEIDREDGAVPTISRACTVGHALLLWAVAAAMLFGHGLTVQAEPVTPESPQCTVDGKIVTCTGDLEDGVEVNARADGTYTELYVDTLDGDIDPAVWTSGIAFTSDDSDIDVTVNTGAHRITTEYIGPEEGELPSPAIAGIYAHSYEGGNITVKMTGTITAEGATDNDGIFARSQGDGVVEVTANGSITTKGARSEGIAANSTGKGAVEVDMTGTITTEGSHAGGIYANSDGNVTVYTDGSITTKGDRSEGISASSAGNGAVEVDVTGTITTLDSRSDGIYASTGDGAMTVTMTGDITTEGSSSDGISVSGEGAGKMEVTVTGDITTTGDRSNGISASIEEESSTRNIDITVMKGTIKTSGMDSKGISAESQGTGAVMVTMTGDIMTGDNTTQAKDSHGISASSIGGDVTIDVTGNITTVGTDVLEGEENLASHGISASAEAGDVTIDVTGDIKARGIASSGIYANADGNINITLNGGTITGTKPPDVENDSASVGVEFNVGSNNTLTISRGAAVTIIGKGRFERAGVTYEDIDVLGGRGNDTINNYGTLTTPGTIDLTAVQDVRYDPGINAFNNMAGATFNSGTSVGLGSDDEDLFSNAGNLSPGGANAVQTTTLTGDFQNFIEVEDENGNPVKEYGTFTVTIDPTATADEEPNDLLKVRGNATLNGGTVRVVGVTYAYDDTYTILNVPGSNTLSGKFDGVIDTLFIDHSLSYVGNTVTLSSTSKGDSFSYFAGTPNQLAVAKALDSLLSPNTNTELVQAGRARTTTAEAQAASNGNNPIVRAVLALTTTAGAQAAYDNLSGEVHASLKGALLDTGQRPVAAVHRRLTARGSHSGSRRSTATVGNLSSLADGQTGFWMIGYDAWSDTKATSNTAQMDTDLGGGLFGIDRALGKHGHVGVLGGYSQTSVAQRARISSGSVETWSVGLYGGAEAGAARLRVGALYNGHSVTARRTVGFTGVSQRLSARYDAWSWQVFGEAGYQLQVRELLLEPFAGVSHTSLETDGFSETGSTTTAALTAFSDTNSRTLTTLGVRSAMELQDTVQARGLVGWRHAFGDTDPSSTGTLRDSSTAITALGAPTAQDAVVTELGLEVGLSAHAVIGVAYQGQYGDGVTVHGFNAGLKLTF